ncbi:unnamed protein product [Spodoptera littoralis]|uniref:Uncharacterized protein n=1 Tax=Spodoptera littoralis TaxID=7109 RepID=A0A9P0IAN8_SPOLI|nr:unnamed protein product [Spodoptera littoralis]CAH1644124.1 unnamed protein product [Spodoptera littoralis]
MEGKVGARTRSEDSRRNSRYNEHHLLSARAALVACSVVADCGPRLKYAWGDALQGTDCPGPDGTPYPRHLVNRALKSGPWQSSRQGRGLRTVDPAIMRRALLDAHAGYSEGAPTQGSNRTGRSSNLPGLSPAPTNSCGGTRLCRTRSSECSLVRGTCSQTYVPYLFLVLPLGPVTLTGQDYVLVESGCVCRPDPVP